MSSDVIRTLKWVFGKGGLIEEYKRQEQMLEETPKSVASMTRIFAPQISRDFPGMNLEQFEALAQQQLVAALQAVSAGNLESVARASDELKEQVSRQIEGNRAAGVRETYEQIRIHQTEISNYEKKRHLCDHISECGRAFPLQGKSGQNYLGIQRPEAADKVQYGVALCTGCGAADGGKCLRAELPELRGADEGTWTADL